MSNKLNNSWAKGYDKWEYSPEGIHNRFAGYNAFATQEQEVVFCQALSKLPKEVVDLAVKIYFTSPGSTLIGEAFTLRGTSLKRHKAIIILYPRLWNKSFDKIIEYIAHEIAHVYLKHAWGDTHSLEKEVAADNQASKWVGRKINYYKRLIKKISK